MAISHMSSPLVSIITPTYNHEAFIAQCIESVLAQTYANWEQIIIDDGSTDKTAEIVRRYDDPRIRYFHQENAGIEALAHTYNRALGMAHGSLVAILEGDDFWPVDKLSLMVPAFEDACVVLAYGEMREADSEGRPARRMSRTARLRTNLPTRILTNDPPPASAPYMLTVNGHSLIPASAVVLRRAALQDIGGFQYVPGLRYVDFPTFIRLCRQGKFHYCSEVVGFRRMHPQSATMQHREQMLTVAKQFRIELMSEPEFALTELDQQKIQESWRSVDCATHYALGRLCLLNGEWELARRHFRQALRPSSLRVTCGGAMGWFLSWIHCDLEKLYRAAGRAALRADS
jgi:glycosyltransferase involved in cell wall biosynthesis